MHSQDSRIERSACDSGSDSDRSDAIDSDVEERILSHLYYQSNEAATAAPDQSNDADTPVDQQSLPSNSADAAPTNGGKTKSDTLKVDPSAAATHTVTSDTMTPSKPFATLALTSPVESDMEKQTMRIALHEPQTSDSIVHTVSTKRPRDEENEYDYLDEAEIQGHNRYFMEEKETICRKCHRGGHIAKDCTTVVCMICGKDDHSAKNCKQTGVVCHGCNMRGHLMSECPQRKGERNARPRACERCGSHKHHTDECSNIWRKYVYNVPPPLKYNTVVAWCYNCAGDGHFGDDCRQIRNRGSNVFTGDTAFSAKNCPGRCEEPTHREGHGSREGGRGSNRDYARSEYVSHRDHMGHRGSSSRNRDRDSSSHGRDSWTPRSAPSKRHTSASSGHWRGTASKSASKSSRTRNTQATPSKKPSKKSKSKSKGASN